MEFFGGLTAIAAALQSRHIEALLAAGKNDGATAPFFEEFILDIGEKLREIRTRNGLSQRELAARAGMTNGAISLIEKNKSSPSVASLKALLDAIPMSMAEFFATLEDDETPKYFYRSAQLTEIAPQDGAPSPHVSLRQLGNAALHQLQMLHENYPVGADTGREFLSHSGEEAGLVIKGRIEVTVDGEVCVLGPGDGYLFESRLHHRFRNPFDEPCEVISACTPPTF